MKAITCAILSLLAAVTLASDYYKPPPRKENGYGYEVKKVYVEDKKPGYGYHEDPYHKDYDRKEYGHVKKYGYKKEYKKDDYHPYKPRSYPPHDSYEPYGDSHGYSDRSYGSYRGYSHGGYDSPSYEPYKGKYDEKRSSYHKGYVQHKEYYDKPHKYNYPSSPYDDKHDYKPYDKHDYKPYDKHDYKPHDKYDYKPEKKVKSVVVKHYYTKKDKKYEPYHHDDRDYGYPPTHYKRDGQLKGYEAAAARKGYYHETTYLDH